METFYFTLAKGKGNCLAPLLFNGSPFLPETEYIPNFVHMILDMKFSG